MKINVVFNKKSEIHVLFKIINNVDFEKLSNNLFVII
jgi:hypothetical protein